ncbi:hypothetical protein D4R86_04110 [bacterium]|nr:MAG: hypothetical protein D4R86_04110 [bacterium]
MKSNLKEIKIEEAKNIIIDKDILKQVREDREPIFKVDRVGLQQNETSDSLVELEIALRKCERVGVFKK